MKRVIYILFFISILFGCKSFPTKTEVESVVIVEQLQVENREIFIKDSSDYTPNFLNALNQEGIEVKYLIDSFYIIGIGDTVQFPELPRLKERYSFVGEKDGLNIRVSIWRRNYNSIAFHITMDKQDKAQYNRKGVAEFGPFFYFGAESDVNIETGNGYLSTEYSNEYDDCFISLRIGSDDDSGEILCKLIKNCNKEFQDITLDNFPNLKLRKE
jgi:hypothetical protein